MPSFRAVANYEFADRLKHELHAQKIKFTGEIASEFLFMAHDLDLLAKEYPERQGRLREAAVYLRRAHDEINAFTEPVAGEAFSKRTGLNSAADPKASK